MMKRIVLAALLASQVVACATTKNGGFSDPADQMQVALAVEGLSDSDRLALEKELSAINGVFNLTTEPGNNSVFVFDYDGNIDKLQRQIQSIKYPGLRPQKVTANLHYEGFDNRGPVIEVISPNTEDVVTETEVEFVVEVKDSDTSDVTVGGNAAKAKQPGIYVAKVKLPEGEQEVEIVARDEAGNESKKTVELTVDTTPPDLEANVKIVVEGKVEPGSEVYVDGQKADVGFGGKWRVELVVKRGQKTVEVVAIDEAGNKTVEEKPIGL